MTITDVCRLSNEVRSGELLISVFLDQAIVNPSSKEADRAFVLRATYPTAPLRSLLEHVTQKLSGAHPKGSAVVRGTYGSGKSHALLALYHVAGTGRDGEVILRQWGVGVSLPDRVRVAAVQLRSENPLTLWQLLFERTGRGDLNEQVRDYPTREQWVALGREIPTLLIVDELEDWFAAQDTREQVCTKNALANLLEAAELPDIPLAVALAVYGTNDELMAIINRVHPPVWDVGTAKDRQKIVRHRLIDEMDEARAKRVVQDYIQAYERARGDLPSLSNLADLRKEMEESYPFHPHFLRQAYQVYAAMPRHESTRGVVGVCATLLRQRASQRDLILIGDLDITDEEIASDLRKLDSELVQNATEDLRQRCADILEAPGIIGTALLHSFSPHGVPGATEEEVLIGNLVSDGNINDLRATLCEVAGTPDGATVGKAWFVDWENGRLVITKEVKLVNQIEQTARARLETPDGREQAAEHLRGLIREAMGVEHLILYPDQPLPSSTGGAALKYIISLMPLRDDEALELLRGLDNTVVLLAPKPSVREKITSDRDLLLRALRVLICEELLKQRSKRQSEVRNLKNRYERELAQRLHGSYARWMRLSRTNELGQEPNFIVRPMECELSMSSVEEKVREQYDLDAMREGIARLLRAQGRDKPKGSEQAGLTIGQIQQGLRRERGLPILTHATNANFEDALRRMVEEASDNGVVVQAGRVLYGYYEETRLPAALSDDWRVWLKPYAPEPPAKEDIKQRVRQELARALRTGVVVSDLKSIITGEAGVATDEAVRAVVELVNDNEAVVEQGGERYPEDGMLVRGALTNGARVWLAEHAPPDDRKAQRRILDLVQAAGEEGITWGHVQAHLSTEGISLPTLQRAVERLMEGSQGMVEFYDASAQHMIRDPGMVSETAVLRVRKEVLPPPSLGWQPLVLSIQPYRVPMSTDLLLGEFHTKLTSGCRIREVMFILRPPDDAADPLFGQDEQAMQLARIQTEHKLVWRFERPVSKEALINLVSNLLGQLAMKGEFLVEATVRGEVPSYGA